MWPINPIVVALLMRPHNAIVVALLMWPNRFALLLSLMRPLELFSLIVFSLLAPRLSRVLYRLRDQLLKDFQQCLCDISIKRGNTFNPRALSSLLRIIRTQEIIDSLLRKVECELILLALVFNAHKLINAARESSADSVPQR